MITTIRRPAPAARAAAAAITVAVLAAAPAAPLQAQAGAAPQSPPPAAAAPADGRTPMHANLAGQYRIVSTLLTRAADAMPEEHYGFQPTPDMRPFLGNITHAALSNYGFCANLRRTKPPVDLATFAASITTKAQAQKALADSIAFCSEFTSALTAPGPVETYTATRRLPDGTSSPVQVEVGGLLANLTAHQNEVYGYTAVYLRLKGIVPPSSAGRTAGRGRAGGGGLR
jgi:hypothetical protein